MGDSWLVLIPQLPADRPYLRVKLQRRVQRLRAGLLKNGVYVLPLNPANSAASEALRKELSNEGGNLVVFGAVLCAGMSDSELARLGAE